MLAHRLRLLRLLLALILPLLGAGCAALRPAWLERGGEAASAAQTQTPSGALQVEIEAAPSLRPVLLQHLDLARLARLSQGEVVSDGELSRLVEATPAQVRVLLQTEGFFNPRVTIEREATPAPGPERVRVRVEAGPQVRIDRLDLQTLDTPQDPPGWAQSWTLPVGAPFRNAAWTQAKDQALARLRSAGYLAAQWVRTEVDIDPQDNRALLVVQARAGPLFRRGEVVLQGLKIHEASTVMNLLDLPQGSPLMESLILDAQDRMQKAGLFERVAIVIDPDPAQAANARVTVQLSELAPQQLTLGVGVSANTGPRLTLEHVHRHVLSQAATARNKVELARSRQAWDGELSTHHREGLYRWVTGVGLERLVSSTDTVLSQRLKFGRSQDSLRIDRFTFAELDRSARSTPLSRTESVAGSLNLHWSWRDIDNPLLPTQGWTVALQGGAGVARSSGSDAGGFGRAYGRITAYIPLGERWYSQSRLEAGQVWAPVQLDVPESLRFRAGGDDSVRGYAYRSLGPQDDGVVGSGKVLLTGSVEVARPLSDALPQLWGAVFVDAGNAAQTFRDYRAVWSTGLGLRWRSPVGPLRLDLAWGRETQKVRLHFSVGIVF